MNQLEVCFSPALYPYRLIKNDFTAVVVDIFRATTSICAALDYGVGAIVPVAGMDEARKYKNQGYKVACERNGQILDFADIGNSPSDFLKEDLKDQTLVFSTTNGTEAINLCRPDAVETFAGSFINLDALAKCLAARNRDVLILCSGWKKLFNLEDSVFAGALTEKLLQTGIFETQCDSARGSLDLWQHAKNDLPGYLSKSSHRNRLKSLVSDEDYAFTLNTNCARAVPALAGGKLVDLAKS